MIIYYHLSSVLLLLMKYEIYIFYYLCSVKFCAAFSCDNLEEKEIFENNPYNNIAIYMA